MSFQTDEDKGGGSKGGQGGKSEFRDFLSVRTKANPQEEKEKLLEHKGKNEDSVEKGKKSKEQLKDIKAGKVPSHQAQSRGKQSYHPLLSLSQQMDGASPNMTLDTAKNEADINQDKKPELTYQPQLRQEQQNKPSIAPKPSPG